jgi:hypothetical protein
MSTFVMSTEEGQFTCRSSPCLRHWIQLIWIVRESEWLGVWDLVFRHDVRIAFGTGSVKLIENAVSGSGQKQEDETYHTVRPETCGCASGKPVQTDGFKDKRHRWIYFGPRKELFADPGHRSVLFVCGVCRMENTMQAELQD